MGLKQVVETVEMVERVKMVKLFKLLVGKVKMVKMVATGKADRSRPSVNKARIVAGQKTIEYKVKTLYSNIYGRIFMVKTGRMHWSSTLALAGICGRTAAACRAERRRAEGGECKITGQNYWSY